MEVWIAVGVVIGVVSGFLGAAIAQVKNQAGLGFVVGLLFGPFGVLIACLLPEAPKPNRKPLAASHDPPRNPLRTVTCPHCAAQVIDVQKRQTPCPRCGGEVFYSRNGRRFGTAAERDAYIRQQQDAS